MTPQRLKRNLVYLEVISKAKKPLREAIINNAPKDLIVCLCDCSRNFLKGNVPISDSELKRLKRYKNSIEHLGYCKGGIKERKKIIQQTGGAFLPLLLPHILTLASTLLINQLKHE